MSTQSMEIQVLGILHRKEEEWNCASFKSCHLHEILLWEEKEINNVPGSSAQLGKKGGLSGIISTKPPGAPSGDPSSCKGRDLGQLTKDIK